MENIEKLRPVRENFRPAKIEDFTCHGDRKHGFVYWEFNPLRKVLEKYTMRKDTSERRVLDVVSKIKRGWIMVEDHGTGELEEVSCDTYEVKA